MITNGTYKAKASGKCVLGTSSEKKTPYLELYFTVADGEHKGEGARWTGYFTEKTTERTIEALILMGWTGEDPSEFADGELHGLDTNEVNIVVLVEEYQDKEGNTKHSPKVQFVNRAGGYLNTENAMTRDAAKAFGSTLRGAVMAMRSKSSVKTSTMAKRPTGVIVDAEFEPVAGDVIPF